MTQTTISSLIDATCSACNEQNHTECAVHNMVCEDISGLAKCVCRKEFGLSKVCWASYSLYYFQYSFYFLFHFVSCVDCYSQFMHKLQIVNLLFLLNIGVDVMLSVSITYHTFACLSLFLLNVFTNRSEWFMTLLAFETACQRHMFTH